MMNWLVAMPEYDALSDRIFSGDALWDWRILTAGLITCVRSSLIWYKRVKNLTDMEICELYES